MKSEYDHTTTPEKEDEFWLSHTPEPKRPPPSRHAITLPVDFHEPQIQFVVQIQAGITQIPLHFPYNSLFKKG